MLLPNRVQTCMCQGLRRAGWFRGWRKFSGMDGSSVGLCVCVLLARLADLLACRLLGLQLAGHRLPTEPAVRARDHDGWRRGALLTTPARQCAAQLTRRAGRLPRSQVAEGSMRARPGKAAKENAGLPHGQDRVAAALPGGAGAASDASDAHHETGELVAIGVSPPAVKARGSMHIEHAAMTPSKPREGPRRCWHEAARPACARPYPTLVPECTQHADVMPDAA